MNGKGCVDGNPCFVCSLKKKKKKKKLCQRLNVNHDCKFTEMKCEQREERVHADVGGTVIISHTGMCMHTHERKHAHMHAHIHNS